MVDGSCLCSRWLSRYLITACMTVCCFGCNGARSPGDDGFGGTPGGSGGSDGSVAVPPECGNGIVESNEECDDGNDSNNDDCLNTCLSAVCGDGVVNEGDEECDDGNDVLTDGCLNNCVAAQCGDGVVHAGVEGCDDGNDDDNDFCRNDCAPASCGDGVVQSSREDCDDGNDSNNDSCLNTCVAASCGDGFVHEGVEECDDADDDNTDDCLFDCESAFCGDGFVHAGVEECDDGDDDDSDNCLATCEAARCGDGVLHEGEEACDDGNDNNNDDCLDTCEVASCGDGFVLDEVEECDDGAEGNGAARLGGCSAECTETYHYEHVLTMDGDGTVVAGSWEAALERVSEGLEDCIIRFDNRVARPSYVEYALDFMRFDFQPLAAPGMRGMEAYAFVSFEPSWRAGLGASYRRGDAFNHGANIIQRSTAQYADQAWNPMEVALYCERESDYEHVASFDSGGRTTAGSWHELYAMVTERAALCKVRVDNRIMAAHHVEFADNWINFDFHGLRATAYPTYEGYEAYGYANITRNTRAGLGASYRRGNTGYVALRDRSQYHEMSWVGMDVDVYCSDSYSELFEVSSRGTMVTGALDDLRSAFIDESRECRLMFDNRISRPEYIEYSARTLRFDFSNLHAYLNNSEAFATLLLNHGYSTQFGSSMRNGNLYSVWNTSVYHGRMLTQRYVDLAVRCREPAPYRHVLTMEGSGMAQTGSWADFYAAMTDDEHAYECRLRLPESNRVTQPVLMEYGTSSQPLLFDYQSLAAPYSYYEAYATAVVGGAMATGMTSSLRRGYAPTVWQRDRNQYPLVYRVQAAEIDFLCR